MASARGRRKARSKARKAARLKLSPLKVAVEFPVPVIAAAKPVVTWQEKGRRLLIQIKDFVFAFPEDGKPPQKADRLPPL